MAGNLGALIPSFFTGPNGERLTPEQIKGRQQIARSLLGQATDSSPNAGGWASVASKVGLGLISGYQDGQAERATTQNATENKSLITNLLGGLGGGTGATGGMGQGDTVANPSVAPMQSVAPATTAQAVPTTVDISGDKQTFIQSLLPAAIEEGARTGVDPRIIVAQAAQETGWGKSAPGNNYFGIKSHGQSGGQTLATNEVIDGKTVRINDSFRQFASPADSVRGYGEFITQNPRYKPLREAQGLDAQLQALQASGYATDPNYSRSVGAIARSIQLPQGGAGYQDPMVSAPQAAPQAGINPAVIAALSSPVANEQTRSVAGMLLNNQFSQQEAARKLAAAQAQQAAEWRRQDALRAQDRSFSLEDRDFTARRQDDRYRVEDQRDTRDFSYRSENDATQRAREDAKRAQDRLYSVEDRNFSADRQDRRFETEDERANREYNYRVQNDSRNRQATINQQNREFDYRVGNDAANRQAPTSNMREYEAYATDERMAGRQPVGRLQYEQSLRKSGANNTNISLNGEKFDEKFGELDAKSLSDTSTAGQAAQRNIGRINQLGELLKSSPNGWQGAFAQKAGEWGIKTEGLDTLQAAQAAINSLVPEQRQPGSGPMSDADLALFKQSLPRIINQPGGNDLIINTMKSIAQYDAEGANIVQQLRSGKLDRAKAFEALQNRVNPLDSFKVPGTPAENPMPSQQTATGWKDLGNGVKIRPKGSN